MQDLHVLPSCDHRLLRPDAEDAAGPTGNLGQHQSRSGVLRWIANGGQLGGELDGGAFRCEFSWLNDAEKGWEMMDTAGNHGDWLRIMEMIVNDYGKTGG